MSDTDNLREELAIQTQTIEALMGIIQENTSKINSLAEQEKILTEYSKLLKAQIDNLPYEICDPRHEFNYKYPKIESHEETIDKIVNHKMSMGRYGDGEFAIMQGVPRHDFQRKDDRLAERLDEVIHSDLKGFIVAIADNFGDISKFNENGIRSIRAYMTLEVRQYLSTILDINKVYADTYITRFYATYKDNMSDAPRKRLNNLKRMWDSRNVIMVEGAKTRLGVGNDLFYNTTSIKRILAPATSSFDRYDDILRASLGHASEDVLFLIAIGPSAAVLAYDLTKEGYQALDIGHIDMEYEWYLAGNGHRCAVPHKYNNEVIGDHDAIDINDPLYESQIIADLS